MANAELPFMAATKLFNGTFTINNPRTGEHRTLRIRTQKKDASFAPGERIISLLIGSDNTNDYKGFGFVTDAGIVVWRKYRSESKYEKLATILWSLWNQRQASPYAKFGLTLIESCRCVFCNRPLTDTLSALTGVGPECADSRGIDRESLPKRPTLEMAEKRETPDEVYPPGHPLEGEEV